MIGPERLREAPRCAAYAPPSILWSGGVFISRPWTPVRGFFVSGRSRAPKLKSFTLCPWQSHLARTVSPAGFLRCYAMILIERFAHTRYGTLGKLTMEGLHAYTIELPWRGNRVGESCIPPGVYKAQRHESPTHGDTLWLRQVPGRSEILIHSANGPHQLEGCIAPGDDYGWWHKHGELAVWHSRETLTLILEAVSDSVNIEIMTWRPEYL